MEKNILIFDDDILIMETTDQLLKAIGYSSYTAKNSPEVYSIIKNNRIDIFIIDFNLENENSGDIIKQVKGLSPETKIIVSSGLINPTFSDDNINNLIENYLNKPYTLEDLKTVLENI